MRYLVTLGSGVMALSLLAAQTATAAPFTIYSNLVVTDQLGAASRTDANGKIEIEAGDDFITSTPVAIQSATFIGLVSDVAHIEDLNLEIYRVFPKDSVDPPSGNVPTRMNSPSDNAFEERTGGDISFTTTVLANSFTAQNSVLNGINPKPNNVTMGEGPVTGQEVRIDVTFKKPILLPTDHYFFVPQVGLSNAADEFYWLSASRPIAGPGTTPINPDLQAWIRNENLAPDWLRIGTDIIDGNPVVTYNTAFQLQGRAIPEPATLTLLGTGLIGAVVRRRRQRAIAR